MRIISGKLKGRTLVPPKNFNARPTTDFAKEGLFNMLENTLDFSTLQVLDLFAGSGGIAYEFISRGCPSVTSIEMNPVHARFIKDTARLWGISNQLKVVHHNVFDFLKCCTATYNLIFADPPYDLAGLDTLPQQIFEAGILSPEGLFILEHPASYTFSETSMFKKEKKYGNVHFTFFADSKTLSTFALPNNQGPVVQLG